MRVCVPGGYTVIDRTDDVLAVRLRQAARMLGISPKTLWTLARRGGGPPHIRLPGGRALLFPIDGLRLWLTERSRPVTPPLHGEGGINDPH